MEKLPEISLFHILFLETIWQHKEKTGRKIMKKPKNYFLTHTNENQHIPQLPPTGPF